MISTRRFAAALVAVIGLTLGLGGGAPRPEVAAAADALVAERVTQAGRALAALRAELEPALAAARAGSARIVAGDEPPGPPLRDAADLLRGTQTEAAEARRAVAELERALRARSPDAGPLAAPVPEGELASIAAQLERTVEAAETFHAMRRHAAGVPRTLEAALERLEARDVEAAAALVDDARSDHAAVDAWETDLATLPVWTETADAMIRAVDDMVDATRRGDAAAATEAAAAFSALADEAATADRGLRIAMSEGGGAVAAAPLGRLASVLAAIDGLQARVARLRQEHGG